MKQITLSIPRPVEERTFNIYKANNLTIPESYPVVEMHSILDFLTQCDEHLYEVKGAVYYMPSNTDGNIIYCCTEFWNKYDKIIKAKEKTAAQQKEAEQQ